MGASDEDKADPPPLHPEVRSDHTVDEVDRGVEAEIQGLDEDQPVRRQEGDDEADLGPLPEERVGGVGVAALTKAE